jgi:hypothetical protein
MTPVTLATVTVTAGSLDESGFAGWLRERCVPR